MGKLVIMGRLEKQLDPIVLSDLEYLDNAAAQLYCRINNYPLESFIEVLTTITPAAGGGWFMPDVGAFILECERLMPKISNEMEDLDHYFAMKVLDHLPQILIDIKKDYKLDQEGRESHYFISFVTV